jgi:hypothetical protein
VEEMAKLRFLHIPKTAGSTFWRILRKQYKTGNCFKFTGRIAADKERYSALSEDEKKSIELFVGHAPLFSGIMEADQVPIITMLRDPVSRVKSYCQHVSEGKSLYLLEKYPPETFNLDEFLCSDNSELSNLQSRMLINYEANSAGLLIDTLTPDQIKRKSIDNLFNKVASYGLQEYFDDSLMMFTRKLGWCAPYYENVNRKNNSCLLKFEQRHIDKIIELNSVDLELYRVAREAFEDTLLSDREFISSVEKFKRMQKFASPLIRVYRQTGRYVKRNYRAMQNVK